MPRPRSDTLVHDHASQRVWLWMLVWILEYERQYWLRDDALRPPQYMYANRITDEKRAIDTRHTYKFLITKVDRKIILKRGSVCKARFISTSFYN